MKNTSVVVLAFIFFGAAVLPSQTAPSKSSSSQNLPYTAVHDPEFIDASQAAFMNSDYRVIGVVTGKAAKAYPAGIVAQHGLVEDKSPAGPIAVTW